MTRKLVLASAGAGKSRLVVKHALERVAVDEKVLILTYTESNQKELVSKFCKICGFVPSSVTIKGWFTFLLEDMIRPYQSCIFPERIPSIYFNPVDPHKRNGISISGTGEKIDGRYNSRHFLTKKERKAHTTYISKLAARVISESSGKPISRLSSIYQAISIDEVQDLTGWDYEVIESISVSSISQFHCVGDFRQTLYSTHITNKKPKDNREKLEFFENIGFVPEHLSICWRCIQEICDFADLVHNDENIYEHTKSKLEKIDPKYAEHFGVFVVRTKDVSAYLDKYQPIILRAQRGTQKELCEGREVYNFGIAKGLGFDRVLICATDKHKSFLAGEDNIFNNDISSKAKNSLYVAITRARFSVAFLSDIDVKLEGVKIWSNHS